MASWQRCDRCRRVLPAQEYEGDGSTCRDCTALPVQSVRARSTVTRTRTAPRPTVAAPAPAGPRAALLGVTGSGDLEVRERRARRAAQQALVESHPEEFSLLLRDARLVEGLRAGVGPTPDQAQGDQAVPGEDPTAQP